MPLSKQWMWPLKAPRGELSKTSFSNCLQLHYHRSSPVARVIVMSRTAHRPLASPGSCGGPTRIPPFSSSLECPALRPPSNWLHRRLHRVIPHQALQNFVWRSFKSQRMKRKSPGRTLCGSAMSGRIVSPGTQFIGKASFLRLLSLPSLLLLLFPYGFFIRHCGC